MKATSLQPPRSRAQQAARFLIELREGRISPVPCLPESCAPRSLAEAYEAQQAFVDIRLARSGGAQIGWKIACTNPKAQAAVQVGHPVFGCLLSPYSSPTPVTLAAEQFRVRCIESEFAFRIGTDVPAIEPDYTVETIAGYVAEVMPSIEIVDHYFEDWSKMGAFALVADNAIHGAWIHGPPVAPAGAFDLAERRVTLRCHGELVQSGSGTAVLGDPLVALAWLASQLPRFGRRLKRGDYVTTGIATDVFLAEPGDELVAEFEGLGRVELNFSPPP
jgi:2-keto-4-pentenoate hydratase